MTTREPRNLDELFDAEEARALERLRSNVRAAGHELRRISGIDRIAREHPRICVLAALGAGVALAPLARGAVERFGPVLAGLVRKAPGGFLSLARSLSAPRRKRGLHGPGSERRPRQGRTVSAR